MKAYIVTGMLGMALASGGGAFAQEASNDARAELAQLKERIKQLEEDLGEPEVKAEAAAEAPAPAEPLRDRVGQLEDEVERLGYAQRTGASVLASLEDLKLGGGATSIAQRIATGADARTGVNFSGDLALAVRLGPYGRTFARALVGQGEGVAGALGSTFSGPNADLEVDDDSAKIVELWYEARLPYPTVIDQRLGLVVGKMDPVRFFDANAAANDETRQFLADIFVNNLAIDWGGDENGYGLGTRLAWRFTSIHNKSLVAEAQIGVFEVGGDLSDAFGGPFVIGEIDVSRRAFGLLGNYRLYAWTNRADHADFRGRPETDTKANWGWGASLDQQLSGDATVFARYGRQDPAVSRFDHVASLGAQCVGNRWGRGGDVLGLAAGYARASRSYARVSETVDHVAVAGGETHVEAYYSYFVDSGVRVGPDVQYIRRPGATEAGGRWLFAVRAQLNF